jgi:peptide/nickel transport system permease protein
MKWRARLAAIWLALWFSGSWIARLLTDDSPHLPQVLVAPSLFHPLGFDAFGRDLLQASLRAAGSSAAFALGAVSLSLILGLGSGLSLALGNNRLAAWGGALLNGLLAFPSLLLALALAAVRGPGWGTLLGSLAIGTLPAFARLILVRSRELTMEDYVLAAQAAGASPARIALKHLLPAQLSLCAIKIPNLFAQALMAEATLSFLGVGAPIGAETWGGLLAQGQDYLIEAPHLAIGVGIPLVLTVLCLQLLAQDLAEKSWNAQPRRL